MVDSIDSSDAQLSTVPHILDGATVARLGTPAVAIMQPYFFPYIGYFQLIAAANIFVLYDDVQYIKNGWSNRNRILRFGGPGWLTFPVEAGPHRGAYAERHYRAKPEDRAAVLRLVEESYSGAPFYADTMPLVEAIMAHSETSVAAFNRNLIETLCRRLEIGTEIMSSSLISKDASLSGQCRVIAICEALGARRYVNPSGGAGLYDDASFRRHGIELDFLKPSIERYDQGVEWVPGLSIIDVLMFNPVKKAKEMVRLSASTEASPDE
jgi:hypothetical protein